MPDLSKKKKIIPIACISLIIFISVFFLSISPPAIIDVYNQSYNNIPVGEIYGQMKIGQTFKADHKDLSAIEILLATYNRENKGTLIFRLKEGLESEDDMVVLPCNMRDVQDNTFYRFSFPKIENYKGKEILFSKGKKYYFYLEAPHAEPGNAITIWSSSEDLYKGGEKIINGVPSRGDLVFKTEYQLGWSLSFHTLATRVVNILSFFINLFKNQVFYFVILLTLFLWVLITLIKKYQIFHRKGGVLFIFGIVFFALSIWIALLLTRKIEVYNQFDHSNTVGEIYGPKKVGQTFMAQYDHLAAIEVLIGTYKRKNSGELIFHLKEQGNSTGDLYQNRVDMLKIKDNRYHRFVFPRIKGSQEKKYYFYLEAPNARPGNAITIWSNDQEDKYREGVKIINDQELEGDLAFKTVYAVGLGEKIGIFLREITSNKPSPLNKKSFYVGLIILFVITGSLFLTLMLRVFVDTRTAEGKTRQIPKS